MTKDLAKLTLLLHRRVLSTRQTEWYLFIESLLKRGANHSKVCVKHWKCLTKRSAHPLRSLHFPTSHAGIVTSSNGSHLSPLLNRAWFYKTGAFIVFSAIDHYLAATRGKCRGHFISNSDFRFKCHICWKYISWHFYSVYVYLKNHLEGNSNGQFRQATIHSAASCSCYENVAYSGNGFQYVARVVAPLRMKKYLKCLSKP